MHKKSLTGVEFNDEPENGYVEAVFASLGVKDHDGDVTLKGAFTDGAPVRISAYNHASWGGALPIGKGTIHEEGDKVVFRGTFFKSQAAQDTREALKELGPLGEWSYGFDIEESEPGQHKGENVRLLKRMKVHEVSPVLLGAGIGTQTLAVKSATAPLSEYIASAVEAIDAAVKRAERVEAIRAEQGLGMTETARQGLKGLRGAMKSLDELLDVNAEEIPPADELTDMQKEFLTRVRADLERM